MTIKEVWDNLGGKEGVERLERTPAGVLIHLKKEDPVTMESGDGLEAVQEGKTLELLLSKEKKKDAEELFALFEAKEKLTVKSALMKIMDVLAGSLVPLMPMLMAAAMFKTLASVLGPDMLKVLGPQSDLYTLFTFVGDAGFYFFPVAVGFTSAQVLGVTPILGMFLGAILIHPTFIDLAAKGQMFSVYGIPAKPLNYSATILPVILSVAVMKYAEQFMKKIVSEALKDVFVPFLTVALVLPLSLCVLAPAGSVIGEGLCNALIYLGSRGGIITVLTIAVLGMLWEFIIMAGMHWLFISSIYMVLASAGQEAIITPMCAAAAFATGGTALGMSFLEKDAKSRSSDISCFIAQAIGGVTEPALYGVGMKYKWPFLGLMAGAFFGSLYAGLFGVIGYNFIPSASFLCFLNYVGGTTMNLIHSIVSAVIGFAVSAGATYMIGKRRKNESV